MARAQNERQQNALQRTRGRILLLVAFGPAQRRHQIASTITRSVRPPEVLQSRKCVDQEVGWMGRFGGRPE